MSEQMIGRRTFLRQAGVAALTASSALQLDALAAQDAVPNSSGTEKPKLKAPTNACDCHHHIFRPYSLEQYRMRVLRNTASFSGGLARPAM